MLGTVIRAGLVLDLFTENEPEWGATAVSSELAIAKSQAHEMLVSLHAIGLLRKLFSGRYRLGWRTVTLSATVIRGSGFKEADRVMQALCNRTGQAISLAVWDGTQAVALGRRIAPGSVRAQVGRGGALPGHCSAVGKVLLAALPEVELQEVLQTAGLPRFTDATIASGPAIGAELTRVRESGLAFDLQELVAGVCCVAAPIRDADGFVVAALGLSAIADRWAAHGDDYGAAVRAAAQCVSRVAQATALGAAAIAETQAA